MKKFVTAFLAAGLLALAASPASAQYRGGNFRGNFGRSVGAVGGYRTFNSFGYGYGFAPQFVAPLYYQQAVVVAAPAVVVAAPQVVAAPAVVAVPAVEAYVVPPVGYYATPLYGVGYETAVFNGRTHYHYPHGHGTGTGHGRR